MIEITTHSLVLKNCPYNNATCEPPIILESNSKVWTNEGHSTNVELNVLTTHKFTPPTQQPYIVGQGTEFGMDYIQVNIKAITGKFSAVY